MKPDFFNNLPAETIIDILSRLPIKIIVRSKCVCKSWLHLLKSNESLKYHLSRSQSALFVLAETDDLTPETVHVPYSRSSTLFELQDGGDLESHDLHYNQLTEFEFPGDVDLCVSANGLVFLRIEAEVSWICNPITRDYIEVRFPRAEEPISSDERAVFGFGFSRGSGQYKVVRLFYDHDNSPMSNCHVYTLGTGSWRPVEINGTCMFIDPVSCVFFKGNVHWLVSDSAKRAWISCFDLETERFSTFSTPLSEKPVTRMGGFSVLDDCLCICDHTRGEDESVVWLMKDYGDATSWSKEYVIKINLDSISGFELYPLKVFQDGEILVLWDGMQLFYYSTRIGSSLEIGLFGTTPVNAVLFTPTSLSLSSLGENVISF